MSTRVTVLFVMLILANFAEIAVSVEEKAPPIKPDNTKIPDKPLIIPDPLPSDPVENAKLAKAILEKSSETVIKMKGFSSKIIQEMGDGQKVVMNIYQRNNPDGTTWLRVETIGIDKSVKEDLSMICIQNDEGTFNIIGNTAIKMAYMTTMQNNMSANLAGNNLLSKPDDNATYSFSEKDMNGTPCYHVKVKINDLENMKKLSKESIPDDMKAILDSPDMDISVMIPVVMEYYIGKNDNFIYSRQNYNTSGKKISDVTYEDVQMNIDIDSKFFAVPETTIIKVANSMTEYTQIMMECFEQINEKEKNEK